MVRQLLGILLALAMVLPARAYTESIIGLSFQDPPGWKASHSDGEQRYEVPASDSDGWALISLRTTELGEVESLTREQILEITRKLAGSLQNFALLGSKSTPVGGLPGHLLSYTATEGKIRLQTTQVLTVRSGRLVLLSLTSPPANHSKRREVFDKLLGSIHWVDPR